MKEAQQRLPPRLMDGDSPGGALLRRAERQPAVPLAESMAWDQLLARMARDAGRRRVHLGLAAAFGALAGAVALYLVMVKAPARPAAVARAPRPTAAPAVTRTVPPAPVEPPRIRLGRAPVVLDAGATDLAGEARVVLAPGARARAYAGQDAATVELSAGAVDLTVDKRPFKAGRRFDVTAAPYRFTVLGTRFHVERGAATVTLDVSEGRVAVLEGPRTIAVLEAGGHWSGAVNGTVGTAPATNGPARAVATARTEPARDGAARAPRVPTAPLPPAAVAARDGERPGNARTRCAARASHDARDGIACYLDEARGADLSAEVGLYEAARLQRDALADPLAALTTLREHRRRFPAGTLRTEIGLSIAELLPRMGRYREALDEITAQLAADPAGERIAELQLLRGHVLREGLHDCTGAERAYTAAAAAGVAGARAAEPATFWRGVCLEQVGRQAEARAAYEQYLAHPGAALASEARRRLDALSREHSVGERAPTPAP